MGKKYFVVTSGDRYDEIIAVIIKAEDREEAAEKLGQYFGDHDWRIHEAWKKKRIVIYELDEDVTVIMMADDSAIISNFDRFND